VLVDDQRIEENVFNSESLCFVSVAHVGFSQ
jgi:hypothetical protein